MIPHRVQLSRRKGWRMPPDTVKVTRPGRYGNPFKADWPEGGKDAGWAVAAFRGWLVQIAVRKVHRRFRRRRLLRTLGFDTTSPDAGIAAQASSEISPEQRAELVLLDRVLAGLPAAERVAWSLRCVEGMRLEEVALACSCSLATVKRRIAAAHAVVSKHVALDTRGGEP